MVTQEQVMTAAEAFLAGMRSEFVAAFPERECPVKRLADYQGVNSLALVRSMERALKATKSSPLGPVAAR